MERWRRLRSLAVEVNRVWRRPLASYYADAARHLLEEAHRYMRKFIFEPLVCLVVEVFVKPQCREASAVGKTHFLADRVVTLAMRHFYE